MTSRLDRDPTGATRTEQRFGWRTRITVAILAAVVSLAAAEAALRLLDVEPAGRSWFAGGNHPRHLFVPDPSTGYRLRPGFTGREVARAGEFDVAVAIDQRGMRAGRDGGAEPPAVLAIGDSMTFGEGVEAEDTFAAVLERETGLRVWNAGVPGYNSRQALQRMEQLFELAEPKLVVIGLMPLWDAGRLEDPFVYRDGYIVAGRWADRLHLIGGNLWSESVDLPVIGPATAQVKARSRLARLAVPALGRMLHPGTGGSPARVEVSIDETARQLAIGSRRAAASGARLLAVLFDSRNDAYRSSRERLEAALGEEGVDCVALDRLLADADWKSLFFPVDGHYNRDGHRAVAKVLAPLVRDRVGAPSGVGAATPPEPSPTAAAGAHG